MARREAPAEPHTTTMAPTMNPGPSFVALLFLLGTGLAGFAAAAGLDVDARMDEATARAMLNRFGYGATPASLAAAMAQSPRQYLARAIGQDSALPPTVMQTLQALPVARPLDDVWARLGPGGTAREGAKDAEARKALQEEENTYARAAVEARLLVMANGDNAGHEALLSFWLNHFSIFAPKGLDKLLAWDYARAIEKAMAEDSFEALLRASFYHPAMQEYLDNAQSTAENSPAAQNARMHGQRQGINENLARELMELHTLGVDAGYTQKDVQELARLITGAGVYSPRMDETFLARTGATRQGLFLFNPRRHDFGEKTFLGVPFPAGEGKEEMDRALHLLATHPATAHHIADKLARRFLGDDPPARVVSAMAEGFRRSNGRISATLLPLLRSDAFAASLVKPAKFKEPVDYLVSAARAACGDTPVGNGGFLAAMARDMGEAPFLHSTPDGYAAQSSAWLSPAAMAKRVRLALSIANGHAPLAQGADDGKPWHGTPCQPSLPVLERAVGPLSPATLAAGQGLGERERAALLLASPEFMHR
jgi:uncharacterized protein (DUF1800 family)